MIPPPLPYAKSFSLCYEMPSINDKLSSKEDLCLRIKVSPLEELALGVRRGEKKEAEKEEKIEPEGKETMETEQEEKVEE